jgi:hypothetical protein
MQLAGSFEAGDFTHAAFGQPLAEAVLLGEIVGNVEAVKRLLRIVGDDWPKRGESAAVQPGCHAQRSLART